MLAGSPAARDHRCSMFETAGALATLQPLRSLVALIAVPALTTLLVVALRRAREESLVASIVAITGAVATFGLSIVFAGRLATLAKGTVLVQHLFQLARLGQLDLAFDLALDPRGATFAVVIATIGAASTFHTVASSRRSAGASLPWTWLAMTGALVITTGDGLAPIMVGLGLLSLGAWGNARGSDHGPSVVTLAGNVGVLVGLVFLFWSLGGSFGGEGYDPDGAPRFVVVATAVPAAQPGKATLAMTSHAGALVSSDDADLPDEPVTAPFSIAVDPGVYTLRIQGGVATGDVVVPRIQLASGRTHVLTPAGPTVSLRVLEDQLVIPRIIPSGGVTTVRSLLTSRAIGGLRASAVVILLVIGSALAHAHAFAGRRGPGRSLVGVLSALPASYLAIRLVPLIDPTTADNALVVLLGAASAVALSARAACIDDAHQALRGVVASSTSIAVVAAGIGEPTAAMVLAVASLVGGCAALGAIEGRRDVRWLGVASAATVGLLPGAGASAGYALTLTTALASATTGSVVWAVFAGLVAIATVFALTFAALAAFRVYDVVLLAAARGNGDETAGSVGQGVVVSVLSAGALAGGAALGVGTTPFGGSVAPLAQRLLGPMAAAPPPPREIAIVGVLLSLVAVIAGVLLARRASGAEAPPRWLLALGWPYGLVERAALAFGRSGDLLHAGVVTMDREVIEDVPVAFGGVIERVGRACAGLVSWSSAKVKPALERGSVKADVKLGLDDPRSAERLRFVVLLVMVALLGVVVLSSFLFG